MSTNGTPQNERLKNAIIYFVQHDKTVKLTKLMKLLYYLDFRNYRNTGHFVTGQTYKAWPKGPVPVDVWEELKERRNNTLGLQSIVKLQQVPENIDSFGFDLKLIGDQKFSDHHFSPIEKKELKQVAEMFKDIPASMMVTATHERGKPWDKVWRAFGQGVVVDYDIALEGLPEDRIVEIREEQADRKAMGTFFGVPL